MFENIEQLKNWEFYRISTSINNKIFLEFQNKNSIYGKIKIKHSVIKNKGVSIYNNTTLYDIFQFNNVREINKYIIEDKEL